MKKHVKNYHERAGISPGEWIGCEHRAEGCQNTAVDIHHVEFGRYARSDEAENLVALCRYCHDLAHGKIIGLPQTPPVELLLIAKERCI